MTSKHFISGVGAAVALSLFAGSADAAAWPTGRPIIVTDLTDPARPLYVGRGIDIARVDGEIVNP